MKVPAVDVLREENGAESGASAAVTAIAVGVGLLCLILVCVVTMCCRCRRVGWWSHKVFIVTFR